MSFRIDNLALENLTADPANPEDGWAWYRSDLNLIRARINGVTRTLTDVRFREAAVSPTANDDNTQQYSVNSVWTNTATGNSYLCSSAATGAAVWKLMHTSGTAVEILTVSWATTKTIGAIPGVTKKGTGYSVVSQVLFGGTAALGVPTVCKVVIKVATGVGSIKLFDVTNSLTIAENTNVSNTTYQIVSLGTLSNLPTGEAIFEVQLRHNTANEEITVSTLSLRK